MENSFRRSAVALRVVQHALPDAIGIHNFRRETIPHRRQRKHARHAVTIQYERSGRQFCERGVLQKIVKKRLNPIVRRAEIICQKTVDLTLVREQRGHLVGLGIFV